MYTLARAKSTATLVPFATTATSIVATPLLHSTRLLFVYFPLIQVCVCFIRFTLFVNAFSFSFTNLGSPTKIERERAQTKERDQYRMLALSRFSLFSLFFFTFLFFGSARFVLIVCCCCYFCCCFSTLYSFNCLLSLSPLSLSLFHSFTMCHSRACTLKAFSDAPRLHLLQGCYSVLLSRSLSLFFCPK